MEFTIGRVENAAGGAATARPAIFDVGANAVVAADGVQRHRLIIISCHFQAMY
jgi:hypothetical protein